jgi:Fur family peroxide stress response transcriptional regulator
MKTKEEKVTVDLILSDFQKKCRLNSFKITPQRVAVYEELVGDYSHPSADDVYGRIKKKHPFISFDTVNRTLISFAKMNIIKIVEGLGSQRRYDPEVKSHHHFQCMVCDTIIDFKNNTYDKLDIPADLLKNHKIMNKRMVLYGICQNCLQNK